MKHPEDQRTESVVELTCVPRHVAIIMDGNGRWAKAKGLQRIEGHAQGAQAVRHAVETATRAGVEYLTLYAFSVANWARPAIEVEALMGLLIDFANKERAELRQNGIRVNVIGAVEDLPTSTRHAVRDLVEATSDGERMTLTLALSYGGRQDIVEAARSLATRARAGLVLPEEIDEAFFQSQMTTQGLPDVDLLIRTGGETRVSDFLLFEAAYAELVFLPLMWPDFQPSHLREAFELYAKKERRFGLTSDQVRSGQPSASAAMAAHPFDPLDRAG